LSRLVRYHITHHTSHITYFISFRFNTCSFILLICFLWFHSCDSEVGHECSVLGAFNQVACSVGFFQKDTAQSVCYACPAGSTTFAEGQVGCTACDPGKFKGFASTNCTDCAPGRFSSFGATECTYCSPGSVSTVVAQSFCLPCGLGTFANTTGSSECMNCAKGKFQDSSNATFCRLCLPGEFAGDIRKSQCSLCQVGRHAASPGQAQCDRCSPGKYAGVVGLSECLECSNGTFQASTGAEKCHTCASSKYVVSSDPTEGNCLDCPPGMTCEQGVAFANSDSWSFRSAAGVIKSFECAEGACLDAQNCNYSSLFCCAPNRRQTNNPLCGQCKEDFYEWGGQCSSCDDGTPYFTIVLIVLAAYVWMGHVHMCLCVVAII